MKEHVWSGARAHWLAVLVLIGVALPLAAQAPNPGTVAVPLRQLPEVAEQGLEPAVARQLREARETLEALLESGHAEREPLGQAYGELGTAYHAYGLAEAAAVCYRNAEELIPGDFRWPYLLARLEHAEGVLEGAVSSYSRALDYDAEWLPGWVYRGQALVALQREEEAQRDFERALELQPREAAALEGLGQIALSRQDFQRAIEVLERALAILPEANRLHYPLALAYRGLGDLEQARAHLAQRGSVGPRPVDRLSDRLEELKQGERVQLLRGRMAFQARRYQEAAAAFAQAVEAAPQSARARINLAAALVEIDRLPEAADQLVRAIELEPDNQTAAYNLGALRHRLGQAEEAVAALERAVELDARDRSALELLARVLRQRGDLGAAYDRLAAAIELEPMSEELRLLEAGILVDAERYREARQSLESALELMPRQGRLVLALARLLAASPDASVRDGERALELASAVFSAQSDAGTAQVVAQALAELGRCEEAANWLEKVLEQSGPPAELPPALVQLLQNYQSGPPCRPPIASEGG